MKNYSLDVCPITMHYNYTHEIDGLVQERRNSSALAMELRLSCTNPSKWTIAGLMLFLWHNHWV